jgi:glycosyltransferase involved in cell wall biosynthesis
MNNKKRILILTDWYDPGYKAGGTIQSCRNFVAAMQDSFDISVLTSDRDLGDTTGYPGIPTGEWIDREGVPVYYAKREDLTSKLLDEMIESLKPDFIYLNSMYSYQFTILPLLLLLRNRIEAQIVLAPHGMLQEGALKFKSFKKKTFISLLNTLGIPRKIHFQATDEQEKLDILKQFPHAGKVEVVPNFSGLVGGNVVPVVKLPHHLRCVYISRIIQKKNILFFLKLLNRLPGNVDLELTIYGDVEDEKYWQQGQKLIEGLPKNIRVIFKGTLPHHEVMPVLGANHVFVLPTLGENFGYAIYEALSAGRPVLISDKTPWRGLQAREVGWDIPLEYPDAWLAALLEAAEAGQETFNRWNEKCSLFVKEQQSHADLKNKYLKLFGSKTPAKNILVLVDWYEPGFKAGGPIQSCRNLVLAMHDLFHITVLTSDRDLGDEQPYHGIPPNRWIIREPGIYVYYAKRDSVNQLLLEDTIAATKPDFIYLNSMYSIRFSILPMYMLWKKKIGAQLILAPRGMLQHGALKYKFLKKKMFISLLNMLGIPRHIHFHATDEQEKMDILKQFPHAGRVDVVPNFSGLLPDNIRPIEKSPHKLRCIYISRIIQKKNILFFLKLLTRLPEHIDLEFTIYGDVEDEKYWGLAKRASHFLPGNIAIVFRGPLPHEQVGPALEAHHVFVLPSKGENFGHAIFESFSAGRPVLISDKTPWRGLKFQQIGWDIPLERPDEWLEALREAACANQQIFNTWCEKCHQFAKAHLDRSDLKNAYQKLFS